jgi:hypothetical protein
MQNAKVQTYKDVNASFVPCTVGGNYECIRICFIIKIASFTKIIFLTFRPSEPQVVTRESEPASLPAIKK